MKREPLAGVQAALEEARDYFQRRVDDAFYCGGKQREDEHRLLTEVEVGLKLLSEVRGQAA